MITPKQRLRIWDRDDGTCQTCGGPGSELSHKEAKKMGGRKGEMKAWFDRDDNLEIICWACHRGPRSKHG